MGVKRLSFNAKDKNLYSGGGHIIIFYTLSFCKYLLGRSLLSIYIMPEDVQGDKNAKMSD